MDQLFEPVRREFFKNVQFAEPTGDPGWFGPDSAVWYVHEHLPTLQIGLAAAAMMETLHPSMAWMGYEHTRAVERINGVPTGRFDERGMSSRTGHSLAFFLGVAIGSTQVAEQVCRTVTAMHDKVSGVRPDGHHYSASDPDLLRWNYATQAWGLAAAHTRYHPRPLRGARLEQFFDEYARMGAALGAAQPPTTKAGVDQLLADSVGLLGVTMPTVEVLNPLAPWRYPVYQRPLYALLFWAVQDLHPVWAQKLMNTPRHTPPGRWARRAATKALLNAAGGGHIHEVRQARARATGHGSGDTTEHPAPLQFSGTEG